MENIIALDKLSSVSSNWAYLISCSESDIDNSYNPSDHFPDFCIRIIRGERCQDEGSTFQEWAAALQFPWYFGHNWDALDECINDLEWLPAKGYIFVITHIDKVLPKRRFETLINIVKKTALNWSVSHESFDNFPRSAIPFHIIFHCDPDKKDVSHKRLTSAGVQL